MTDPYYYSPPVARLLVLLEEVTRAKPGSPETRFIQPEGMTVDRLRSRFHHVLYGRRGTGKSSLLRHIEQELRSESRLVAWIDQETYMALQYPDVLVSTLADTFASFATQLRSMPGDAIGGGRRGRKAPPDATQVVAQQLEEVVAQLLNLKHEPSETDIEWRASFSNSDTRSTETAGGVKASKGFLGVNWSWKRSKAEASTAGSEYSRKYTATKAEHLEKAVTTYRAIMTRVAEVAPDPFIILDDFYRLTENDQPKIAGYFHRTVKDTGVWLKFGSIKYWTRLYAGGSAGGSPSVGLQAPHDIREQSLDRSLLDFKVSKRFLEEIVNSLAQECGVDVNALFSDGAKDRLVLAAGGVPRDYLGLMSEAIAVARSRGRSLKLGSERVTAEDVNEAAGRTVELKYNDLNEDAGGEAAALRNLVIDITNHCRRTNSASFLVDFKNADLVAQMNRLQTMRFLHAIDDNETLPDPQSSRYNVYVLDVSQLAATRAWQVDFMGWTSRERRRARRLVFDPGAEHSEPMLEPPMQLSMDDELAVVGDIDPAVSPSPP